MMVAAGSVSKVLGLLVVVGVAAMPAVAQADEDKLVRCVDPVVGVALTPPGQLLARFPDGNEGMVSEVRNLVAADPLNLQPILALVGSANPAQKRAIGAGLGQAATVCASGNAGAARAIQEAVARLSDRQVVLAFQAASGDRQTAAIGATAGGPLGGTGVGGLSGGFPEGGASTFYSTATSVVPNSASPFPVGGGSSIVLRSSRSTTLSPFGSVSP